MPNRIIRESILTSRAVNSLSEPAEIFYRRLMSIVDDYGRYEADPDILRARLYPLQIDSHPSELIRSLLAEVSAVKLTGGEPLVIVYGDGEHNYLQLANFRQRTRSAASRYPSPDDGHMTVICLSTDGHMTDTRLTHARLDGDGDEDGDVLVGCSVSTTVRGKDNTCANQPLLIDAKPASIQRDERQAKPVNGWKRRMFESEFWPVVWVKRGKDSARKAWAKAATSEARARQLIELAKKQGPLIMAAAEARASPGEQVRPLHPATWLNQRRWEDDWQPLPVKEEKAW